MKYKKFTKTYLKFKYNMKMCIVYRQATKTANVERWEPNRTQISRQEH